MNEKRECTNPDCIEGEVLKMESEVLVDDNEYRELCSKAAALDILAADLKAKIDYGYNYNLVNDDLVEPRAVIPVENRPVVVQEHGARVKGRQGIRVAYIKDGGHALGVGVIIPARDAGEGNNGTQAFHARGGH